MATAEDKSIIMAIVNLTDDSFYPGSRCLAEGGTFDVEGFRLRVRNMVKEGAGILDLGACSTRPRAAPIQHPTQKAAVTLAVTRFTDTIAETADRYGVKDWILDPGFGFAKTVEQNWALLREMDRFGKFGKRILAGLSRKSFLYKPLGITPDEALTATQIADFIALDKGADILRVHDVAEASRTIRLFSLYRYSSGGSSSQKPV